MASGRYLAMEYLVLGPLGYNKSPFRVDGFESISGFCAAEQFVF